MVNKKINEKRDERWDMRESERKDWQIDERWEMREVENYFWDVFDNDILSNHLQMRQSYIYRQTTDHVAIWMDLLSD